MADPPMRMHSAVKLVGVLALVAVATTACASKRAALLNAEQAKTLSEADINGAHRRAVYLKCVLDDANAYAADPAADAIAPGDVADLSLARCRSRLRDADEDFSLELFSAGDDVAHAAAVASRATDVVRARARDQAIAQVVDARRQRPSAPAKANGS